MRQRTLLAVTTALGLGIVLAVPAAPASALSLGGTAPATDTRVVQKIDLVTKCWETPSGRRRCRTVYVNPSKLWNPNRYPVGSTDWWRAMDRNGSGGYRH